MGVAPILVVVAGRTAIATPGGTGRVLADLPENEDSATWIIRSRKS